MTTSAAPEFDCLYEERAAILQYQAFFSRSEAEARAHRICHLRTEQYRRKDGSIGFNYTLVAPVEKKPQPKTPEEEYQEVMGFEDFRAAVRQRFGHE